MGEHQAITALEWGITREAQDELAASAIKNLLLLMSVVSLMT